VELELYAIDKYYRPPIYQSDAKRDWMDASTAILGRMSADKFPEGGEDYNEEVSRLALVHESQIFGRGKNDF
jgi:hypothetical protein